MEAIGIILVIVLFIGLLIFDCGQLRDLLGRLDALEHRTVRDRLTIESLETATGGLWMTKDGYLMQVRDMETEHIRALLKGGYPKTARTRNMLEDEMNRRVLHLEKLAADMRREEKR